MFRKPIDFLSVGDITTDAFIRLKEASVHCNINKADCELCVKFADKIPFESVTVVCAVGNSPNAAVSASRLGLTTFLVSNVGRDRNGAECIQCLHKDKVSTKYVKVHHKKPTNYHYVLWYEDERTIMVNHTEYDYKFPKINRPVRYLYLSSLASNTLEYHKEIIAYLKAHPDTKLAFQPGTFQMKLGLEKLGELYTLSHIFFCNIEEAQRILGIAERDPKTLLKMMHGKGPKIVVLTDGPKGAYASDGANQFFMPPYPDKKAPFERTGAGDAFASTFTSALALGKTIEEALMWAPINSASVVQHIGAQEGLLSKKELEEWLKSAPADYKPRKI